MIDENKYCYFWIFNPIENNLSMNKYKNWTFYSLKDVKNGLSPIGDLGEKFYLMLISQVSLHNCIWIFSNKKNTFELSNKLSKVLKTTTEAFCYTIVSNSGSIVYDKNDNIITIQPPFLKSFETIESDKLGDEKLKRIINITENIFENNLSEYYEIIDYLREIKQSKEFIGQLALWSFLEHHWASETQINTNNTSHDKSLAKLLNIVYDKRDRKVEIENFKKTIASIGIELGKTYNEKHLRNILAHGKHYTLKENWTETEWKKFFLVHKSLFDLVIKGIEKEISELINSNETIDN